MRLYAIDYIDDAHDSAELEFSREPGDTSLRSPKDFAAL